ncbi:MAG: hypothetical protein MK137_09425, partial [Rickettsiales bacterium]|nr:hypothetical protein [Rickettsiales bacterium]
QHETAHPICCQHWMSNQSVIEVMCFFWRMARAKKNRHSIKERCLRLTQIFENYAAPWAAL